MNIFKKIIFIFFSISLVFVTFFIAHQKPLLASANSSRERVDLNPLGNLQVRIPGIEELARENPIRCENGVCKIPWIGIYIYAIYNYLMIVGGIVSIIVLMIGGLIWLTAGGSNQRVSQAKSWITGSFTGITLLLTSYILLHEINPDLVRVGYVEIRTIERLNADTEATPPAIFTGMINESGWIKLPSHPSIINNAPNPKVDPLLAEKAMVAFDCIARNGYKARITSLSRTLERQAQIYLENYDTGGQRVCVSERKRRSGKNQACCPFRENSVCPHNTGKAIDIWAYDPNSRDTNKRTASGQRVVQKCMFEAGFCIIPSECWHFEAEAMSAGCSRNFNFSGASCRDLSNNKYP